MRKILLLPLVLMIALTMQAQQTSLRIEFLAGFEDFDLAKIGKIMFSDNLMILYGNDGMPLGSTSTDMIDKIVFHEIATSLDEAAAPTTLRVFPSPAQDALFVRGVQGQQTVRIFSIQGQILQSALTADGEANLQVGGLPNGTYLLQVGAQIVKFIKE